MKFLSFIIFGIILSTNLLGQQDTIQKIISKGNEYLKQENFDDAISYYKAALKIDKNSVLANYELARIYMNNKQFGKAARFSKIVIKLNGLYQEEAYLILGSSQNMLGKPKNAIKVFEESLTRFPNNYLLNYNLANTLYDQQLFDKAELRIIKAISLNHNFSDSHYLLSNIMKAKGLRVRSLLPLYYFLMLEPTSTHSKTCYYNLRNLLGVGIQLNNEKSITVNVPFSSTKDSVFDVTEKMLDAIAISKYNEINSHKSDMDYFIETNTHLFSSLAELKKENRGFWWDLYIVKFYSLIRTNNLEAFSYFISQSKNSEDITKWIEIKEKKMLIFKDWLKQQSN